MAIDYSKMKYLDLTGLSHLWSKIDDTFIRKENGKGLITDDEKSKLGTIEENAQVNKIERIAVVAEGATSATLDDMLTVTDKTAVLRVETAIADEYTEKTPIRPASTKAVKEYVDGKISDISNQISQKNVQAEGDAYVSASATTNKVIIETSQAVKDAADKAAQTASGDSYISATIANKVLSVSASVATDIANAGANKLADAQAVKSYVVDEIAKTHVGAEGDNSLIDAEVVAAAGKGNTVKVSATQDLIDAVANANSAMQSVNILGHNLQDGGSLTVEQAKNDLGLGSAAYVDLNTTMSNDAVGAVQTKVVKSYIDEAIDDVKGLVTASTQFLGVADAAIVPGTTKETIKVGGKDVTAGAGDIVMFGTSEYIWDGADWVLLGDTTAEMSAINDLNAIVYGTTGSTGLVDRTNTLETTVGDSTKGLVKKVDDLEAGNTTVKSFGGQAGDITVDDANTTAGEVKFAMNGKQLKASVNGWSDLSGKANTAIQTGSGDDTYIGVSKTGTELKVAAKLGTVGGDNGLMSTAMYTDAMADIQHSESTNDTAISKVATSVTQSNGVVTVTYTNFAAITDDEIDEICK